MGEIAAQAVVLKDRKDLKEIRAIQDHKDLRVKTEQGVVAVGSVRVLPTGGLYRMDMRLEVDGKLTVAEALEIAHRAEAAVLNRTPLVTEVHVHVEPSRAGEAQ